MTEDDARQWLVSTLGVSRETLARLDDYRRLVLEAQSRQNLISASTIDRFWVRHIVDSAQLLRHVRPDRQRWLDIGSGAGLPGIVIAILTGAPVMLVEPRTIRAAFLQSACDALHLTNAEVAAVPVARVRSSVYDVITARAVAPLPRLIAMAAPFADLSTIWILPKGRSASNELASLPRAWQGCWQKVPSVTDPDSMILFGTNVQMKGRA